MPERFPGSFPEEARTHQSEIVLANAKVSLEPFMDIVGRHFKQPKEGLGYDNSPSAHMWRTMIRPDNPL